MQIVNLQIAPTAVNPVINVSQGDIGRQFKLKLYDGSVEYSLPAGAAAQIDGIKPDGHAFSYSDCVSVSGNEVTVTTKQQMTIVAGTVQCEIRFTKSGLDIGTLNFNMIVERSPINGDTDLSDTELPAIIELARQQEANAEAWATGTKNGLPVSSSEPQYHNNSKFYAEQAGDSADAAHDSQIAALNSELNARDSATLSESWAVGHTNTRGGEDTNNSKYWAQVSESYASEVDAYIAIIKILFDKIYLDVESGDRLSTESGDNFIMDY